MADVVVTVPKKEWEDWIAEGDLPGEEWSGKYSFFWIGKFSPKHLNIRRGRYVLNPPRQMACGDRVYVVSHGKLRGYSPLVDIDFDGLPGQGRCALVRCGGAVAVTIDEEIKGFRGFRYRWWDREDEKPFPDWRIP